jgi:hypothetical protein
MEIRIEVRHIDALKIPADVLVLKYAQDLFGVDAAVFAKLALLNRNLEKRLPKPDEYLLLDTQASLGAAHVLFTGVVPLPQLRYREIRDFAFNSLQYLAGTQPDAEHICFTLHGATYGLDESEAFESEIGGIVEAIARDLCPSSLKRISFVEINEARARRLRSSLSKLLPEIPDKGETTRGFARRSTETGRLSQAGINSEEKPLIFVAMPFDKKMHDIFHYGIRNAVNQAGYLCERADEVVFTGDILELIKRRIGKASLVIADLTTANPNVYLEVGYAWGVGIPTVLIAQDPAELKFDVKGQKCIIYSGIRELEEKLSRELIGLKR